MDRGGRPSLLGPNRAVTTAVLVLICVLSFTLLALIALQAERIAHFASQTVQMTLAFSPRPPSRSPTGAPRPISNQRRLLPGEPAIIPIAATPARMISDAETFVRSDDYPADALQQNLQGTVRFEVRIDPAGRVRRCDILETSHVASLDRVTCRLALQRLRFAPARDTKGKGVWASYTRRVRWTIPA